MRNIRLRSVENRNKHLSERNDILRKLRSTTHGINLDRLYECKESILKAYEDASIVKHLADIKKEQFIERYRFRSIGLYHRIRKNEFNARNFYWGPYFSDVGRAVAFGEKKYIFNRLGIYVRGCKETISRENPNFEVINMKIHDMLRNDIVPNTVVCPIQIFANFIKYFGPNLDWSSGNGSILKIENCNLRTIWSHSFARLRSFIILDSRAGIWYVMPNEETKKEITIAIGESIKHAGYIEYWVETLAYYKIKNINAFVRINLST